jgi:DNA-binding NtrC family response regulator
VCCMPLKPVNILVVDDDQLVRDFAVHTIEYGMDRRIEVCDTGFSAWRRLQDELHHVDIIIADANLPEMSGFELLERVKMQMPQKKVIITAGDPAFEKRARLLGADAFISKPFQADDLLKIVNAFATQNADQMQVRSQADGTGDNT